MSDFADAIADYLEAQGVGTVETDLFVGRFPDDPDACIMIKGVAGGPPDYVLDQTTPLFEFPRAQIWTRAKTYAAAHAKAKAIQAAMEPLLYETILNGDRYAKTEMESPPWDFGRDARERVVFTQIYTGQLGR